MQTFTYFYFKNNHNGYNLNSIIFQEGIPWRIMSQVWSSDNMFGNSEKKRKLH